MINQAKECWESLSAFRRKRNRCIDYTFGRQWNDIIEVDGRRMTEYEYILREGNLPLKNNLIRRIVRNVVGVFRKELPGMMAAYTGHLKELAKQNELEEIFSRVMEEFLISGMAVVRKRMGLRDGRRGVWTETVSPSTFFFNSDSRDVRGWDVDIVGQFHDVNFRSWCDAFVRDAESYRRARNIFGDMRKHVRITEMWRRELHPCCLLHDERNGLIRSVDAAEAERLTGNRKRWSMRSVWRYYFLSEDGSVLKEGDSPYRNIGHPYVFKCYPMLDGEIQSFVGDMIDQQRYANRLITLYDWVVRASAKGVLLLPRGAVAPEDLEAVADQWSRFNGVIVYKSQPGVPDPHQVSGNNSNIGISELLEIQLKMLEDVSGVTGTLQGNIASNSVSGTLYNQQTENAKTSLCDLMETFRSFINENVKKDMTIASQMFAV